MVPHHMSHGNIEQGNQETKGCDKPPFHMVHFFRCHIFRRFLRFGFSLYRCAITAAFHRMDNIRRTKGIVVILHHHTVLEQVYVDTLDTFQLADAFLHMAEQAEQVIPVTSNFCFMAFPPYFSILPA
mgnify:CR=1 FL=1